MARTPKVVEDRREQILEAALRVFAKKGFARATNKDIAQEAGITAGLIYHYFASKEALLHAIIEHGSPVQGIRTLPTDLLTQPPELLLRFLVQQMLAIGESEQFLRLVRVFLPELLHNEQFSLLSLSTLQEATAFLEKYLNAKMDSGELRQTDPALTAQTIFSAISGFILRRQILRDPQALQYSHEQIAEYVVTTILHGLRSQ